MSGLGSAPAGASAQGNQNEALQHHEAGDEVLAVYGTDRGEARGTATAPISAQPPLAAFLTAAHELRAPLAWLLGEVEALRAQSSGPLNPAQSDIARHIADTCVRMQRIVEDCFAYGRLESGEMSFHADVTDLGLLMQELAAAWAPAFAKKQVSLDASPHGKVAPLACDPHKLLRVVSILLENALKFTPSGGEVQLTWQPCIWLHGEQHISQPDLRHLPAGSPGPANAVSIRVRDTGPGIAPENQLEIFEPFVSLGRGDTDGAVALRPSAGGYGRRKEDVAPGLGLGLGLAVARRLVQWHGGKIWVESELHHGCTFSVMLPIRP